MRDPLIDDMRECCTADYDYELGQYVHEEGCTRREDEE